MSVPLTTKTMPSMEYLTILLYLRMYHLVMCNKIMRVDCHLVDDVFPIHDHSHNQCHPCPKHYP